ncbi:hydroxyneurosporene methyltransferase [Paenibacillus athensensis]|uniref:Hydroxyneurosporene methyltransferase n=1 Tax=Paenibacillus athensensis TaxID=1967502 RepID=A0A4Y8Q8W8_9BACL|nr:methyltransferase [Paenibacillus athensensis]MCD1260150.1 hydroxyneurosporene methyltransferase [Paenibacillus athensensis]
MSPLFPEPRPNLEALSDLCTPWCLHVVGTLRVAERLDAGVCDIGPLAEATGSNAVALHTVMDHLAAKGVFDVIAPGRFALNDVSRGLLDPQRRPDLNGIGGRFAYAWGTLPTYVRTGAPGYSELFGLPFWEDLAAHPELGAEFDALMGPAGHGTPNPDLSLVGGWDAVRAVVDVGGGTGSLLIELLRAHPRMRGVLVDLPHTAARAAEPVLAAGLTARLTVVGQSFFEPLPAGADLYLLHKVLGNWPDAETVAILHRCAEAARPGGRVLVIGGVCPDDAPRRLDLEKVLLGGTTSTLSEFRRLAAAAGLVVAAAGVQPSGRYAVECHPA